MDKDGYVLVLNVTMVAVAGMYSLCEGVIVNYVYCYMSLTCGCCYLSMHSA